MTNRLPRFLLQILLIFSVVAIAAGYMFFGQRFLRAECIVEPGAIGIPGITKTYSVALVNKGPLPVRISGCDVTTDAGEQGIELRTSIEKWERTSHKWIDFWGIPATDYCNREPDIISARRADHWLWPGKRVSTGEIAIQASDGLQIGDQLRWNVFPRRTETVAIVSVPFTVDERPQGHLASR